MSQLQQRYDQVIEHVIALHRAIAAHCRGEMADIKDCPHHGKILNDRLEVIQQMERDLDGFVHGPL
jgi:hypothetical protein